MGEERGCGELFGSGRVIEVFKGKIGGIYKKTELVMTPFMVYGFFELSFELG